MTIERFTELAAEALGESFQRVELDAGAVVVHFQGPGEKTAVLALESSVALAAEEAQLVDQLKAAHERQLDRWAA